MNTERGVMPGLLLQCAPARRRSPHDRPRLHAREGLRPQQEVLLGGAEAARVRAAQGGPQDRRPGHGGQAGLLVRRGPEAADESALRIHRADAQAGRLVLHGSPRRRREGQRSPGPAQALPPELLRSVRAGPRRLQRRGGLSQAGVRMTARIIDGKAIAARVRAEVAEGVKVVVARAGMPPGLAAVRVGEDPASVIYVRNKIKACKEAGLESFEHVLPERTSQEDLLGLVSRLNADRRVHGILVQLPLPRHIDADRVIDLVAPEKDVDGFGPRNVAALTMGRPGLRPCTPAGCIRLLDEAETTLEGARALVVGRSLIVGKPMSLLLLERHATVTIAHSRTQDLAAEVARATVIDVGMNRLPDGKLKGDVEFAAAAERARAITPVPGGVGPMTIAFLLMNTLAAARAQLRVG